MQDLSDPGPHAWHRVISVGTLKPQNNELIFAVAGSEHPADNTVRFFDVVIFYTSTQLTVRKRRDIVAHP